MNFITQIGDSIITAASYLQKGQIVGIPTETVYGLAADALDSIAVARIFEAKNRPAFNPLIMHVHSAEQAQEYVAQWPNEAALLVKAFWPGPLTLLLPKSWVVPDIVTAGNDTVALRMPAHPLALALLKEVGFPLAAPSANPFGYISPTTATHVADQLGHKVPYILDGGKCSVGIESTIIGFPNGYPTIFRQGGLSQESIETIIGKVQVRTHSVSNPQAPGLLSSHYAPRTPLIIGDVEKLISKYANENIAILTLNQTFCQIDERRQLQLSQNGDLQEAATNLFSYLRFLDSAGYTYILSELLPDTGLGRAINDRLRRAAAVPVHYVTS